MFCYLFFEWKKSLEELYKFVSEKIVYKEVAFENNKKVFVTKDFQLRFHINKTMIGFKNEDYEDYNVNFSIELLFDVRPNTKWCERLFEFSGAIMSKYDGACLIEFNGDTPVLFRVNNEIIVDDSKLNGKGLPYEMLNMKYTRGTLERR